MRKLLFILLLIPAVCFSQTVHGTKIVTNAPAPAQRPLLIIEIGESNVGGEALNTSASTLELSSRSAVQIFNNKKYIFENIHIGHNNNIYHVGLDSTTHGWQIGLTNKVDSGFVPRYSQVYLLQASQGGSTISQWGPTDAAGYYDTLINRTTKALTLVSNPIIVVWYSQGINDGSSIGAPWRTATEALFNNFKSALGINFQIVTPQFMPGHDALIAAWIQVQSEYPGITISPSTGASYSGNHWDYSGFKNQVSVYGLTKIEGLIY